jgi:YegS/Rv2252/BmrU family lipid kinase
VRGVTQRCVIIRNPASRRQLEPAQFEAAAGILRAAGWDVTTSITEHAGHATVVAREAAAQLVDVVVANGGDGTINEVVNGLAGTEAALGVLPGGTANVWAKEAGIPKDPAKAMRVVLHGERRRVDLGVANGRPFLLMAGVGLDAAIIPRVSPAWKRRVGALAYIATGVRTALGTKPWDVRLIVDGETIETPLFWMLAGNTRNYGGLMNLACRARMDDGRLDLVLMKKGGLHLVADGVRALFQRHEGSSNIVYRQVTEIAIETADVPVQLDGDDCGATPLRIGITPRGLTVIVPRGRKSALFAEASSPSQRGGQV